MKEGKEDQLDEVWLWTPDHHCFLFILEQITNSFIKNPFMNLKDNSSLIYSAFYKGASPSESLGFMTQGLYSL